MQSNRRIFYYYYCSAIFRAKPTGKASFMLFKYICHFRSKFYVNLKKIIMFQSTKNTVIICGLIFVFIVYKYMPYSCLFTKENENVNGSNVIKKEDFYQQLIRKFVYLRDHPKKIHSSAQCPNCQLNSACYDPKVGYTSIT